MTRVARPLRGRGALSGGGADSMRRQMRCRCPGRPWPAATAGVTRSESPGFQVPGSPARRAGGAHRRVRPGSAGRERMRASCPGTPPGPRSPATVTATLSRFPWSGAAPQCLGPASGPGARTNRAIMMIRVPAAIKASAKSPGATCRIGRR